MSMASARSIRKLHQQQMAVTVAVRKVLKYWREDSVRFSSAEDAAAYLRGITENSLAFIHTGEAIIPKAWA